MAVTVQGTPTQAIGSSVSSITWSFNATSCTGLFVGGANQGPQAFSSCTYNGTAMTELWDLNDDIGVQRVCGYLMVSPASGANNVVLTCAGTADPVWGGAVGLAGLETSSVGAAHRTVYTADGNAGANPTVTVVDSQNGDLVIDSVVDLVTAITAGAGQTSQVEDDSVLGSSTSAGISTESATGGNTVMSWTGGSFWAIGATALVPASGGGTTLWAQSLL